LKKISWHSKIFEKYSAVENLSQVFQGFWSIQEDSCRGNMEVYYHNLED